MKANILIVVLMLCMVQACGPSKEICVASSWVNRSNNRDKVYSTIFVAALTERYAAKTTIEDNLANTITAYGYKVIKSGELFAPNFNNHNASNKQSVLDKINQAGCDAILTVALVDGESESRYSNDDLKYVPYTAYQNNFWDYYCYAYPKLYKPGYVVTDRDYFLENNLFDVRTGQLLWSAQTKTNTSLALEKMAEAYEAYLWQRVQTDFFQSYWLILLDTTRMNRM